MVGLPRLIESSDGDPMIYIPLQDAHMAQFLKDDDALLSQRRHTEQNPASNRPDAPDRLEAAVASQASNSLVAERSNRPRGAITADQICFPIS